MASLGGVVIMIVARIVESILVTLKVLLGLVGLLGGFRLRSRFLASAKELHGGKLHPVLPTVHCNSLSLRETLVQAT